MWATLLAVVLLLAPAAGLADSTDAVCISQCAWGPTPTRSRSAAALRAASLRRLAQAAGASSGVKLLFFVASDCPLSNYYARDVQELCRAFGPKGIGCSLVYEDVSIDEAAMRKHLAEYGYQRMPAVIDRDRAIARRVGASVTPQAIVVGGDGEVRYRGRIDNRYEELGKPRRVVTVHDLRDALDAIVAGKPVPRPETTALGCYIVSPEVLRKQP